MSSGKCKVKTTRYHNTLRRAKIQNTDNTKCWWGWGTTETHWLLLGTQSGTAALEGSLAVSTKQNILLPYNPVIVLLGIYPKELKTYAYTKICTQKFIADLFLITKTWKQPQCPSVGEWINKLWYIQIMEYYSTLKRNELSSHEKTWRKFKCILLSERSQSGKATSCMISTIQRSRKGKTMETLKRSEISND